MARKPMTQQSAPAAAGDGDRRQVIACLPIHHDGRPYAPGDVLDVDAPSASTLIAAGAARPVVGPDTQDAIRGV